MSKSLKKLLLTVAGLAAFAIGGAAIADASTSQGSKSTTTTSTTTTQAPTSQQAPPNFPAHGTAAHEDAEKAVTGTDAAKAQAAAVRSLGGGTAGAVTTDYVGRGYEVTVTNTDGTKVEVHLDSAFNVMQGPPGAGRGAPPSGAAPPSSSTEG
jgi:hypothetical protein